MASDNRGRSNSPRPRPWSAADSDRCECVLEVKSDDVLLGRGSGPNDHVGNIKFRDLVHERKAEYLSTNHRQTKAMIAKDIVDQVYARGGRFLKKLSPVESAKKLPELLAKNADDPENDRSNDMDSSGPCDVYQIQKHATVMEKAKQALRQNQRNGSQEPPERRPSLNNTRRGSLGQSSVSSDHQPHNWGGMQMGNMNIPTTLNNSQHGNFNGRGGYQNNNLRDSFDQNQNFNNSSHGRNQDYQQQLYQQQQDLMNLQKQHDLLQQQMQYQQQRQQNQQFQSQQMEMETHNQLLQEQLELQIRQEQLRQLQQQHMQKFANSMAMYKNQQDGNNDRHQMQGQSQNSPPAVLNGYATYTTTLDAIEDGRQNATDGLADPNEMMHNDANNSLGNISDGSKLHEKFDEKSMQMSTMMGSFKDMSVNGEHSMHGSGDTIGTIDNVPSSLAGLSMVHMSGISIMSMMNDSSDSLFKNPHKAGNDVGAKNASWGSTGSPNNATPNSSQAPLADVVESANPAAIAAAAVLGKPVPGFEKAQRRWSGGFMPPTEVSAVRRVNRRGSLQYTSNNQETNQMNNQMNTMATANAMLQMAHNQQLQQSQNFNQYNNSGSGQSMSYGGGQDMMNASNQQYMMENSAYDNQGDSNMAFHNN